MLIVKKIKKLALNYDLWLIYADSKIKSSKARMELLKGFTSKRRRKSFTYAKIDYEKYTKFYEEIAKEKQELFDNLKMIFERHNKNYYDVFVLYYLKGKSIEEISQSLGISNTATQKIIYKINDEVIFAYKTQ